MTFRPKRCPFLFGEMFKKTYPGKTITGSDIKCDFRCSLRGVLFNSQADIVEERGCLNGEYIGSCNTYSEEVYSKSITIPLICPLVKKEGEPEITKCNLDLSLDRCELATELLSDPVCQEGDYRSCEIFSKWFWEKEAPMGKSTIAYILARWEKALKGVEESQTALSKAFTR